MITILNTSILTQFGDYRYESIDLEEAQRLVAAGFESAVGHDSTAKVLTTLLGVEVAVNRVLYEQQVGDRALVFKLRGRPPEGVILSQQEIEEIGFDFGLLTRGIAEDFLS